MFDFDFMSRSAQKKEKLHFGYRKKKDFIFHFFSLIYYSIDWFEKDGKIIYLFEHRFSIKMRGSRRTTSQEWNENFLQIRCVSSGGGGIKNWSTQEGYCVTLLEWVLQIR